MTDANQTNDGAPATTEGDVEYSGTPEAWQGAVSEGLPSDGEPATAPLPPAWQQGGDAPTIVRGARSGPRLVPRPDPPKDATIVTRHMLRSRADHKPQTDRQRKIAGDLPDWEPLPPGELTVVRH